MRIYYFIKDDYIDHISIETGYDFKLEVFPFDFITSTPDNKTKVFAKGFYGNTTNREINKYTILTHLHLIQQRKLMGWEKYQIKGISINALNLLEKRYNINKNLIIRKFNNKI